ncbi:uncharacterized protein [Leptinotarsa decemlineata]|uniref:uncharacterized protein n=1 Tax=Leptinotarsa decemlineata TaxID=7539 RepID=UPI003D304760
MHNEKKYPFHGTGVQGLEETDPARRIRFCRFLLNADIDDAWFLKSILWTDESKFSREGITNFHNLHEWADKDSNPNWKKQISFQRQFSINVWAGVIGRTLVGPHILPDNLNGQNYLEFMINDLPRTPEPLFFWQLDRERRTHPLAYQIARPDFVGFFLWGRAKELVYTTEITTREELLQRIEAAFEIMKQEIQMKVTTTEVRNR